VFYEKNNIWIGLAIGIIVPFVSFAIFIGITESLYFRRSTCAILALCINTLIVRFFRGRKHDESLRGIVIATAVYAIAWFFVFGQEILKTFIY
jgi:hypothetical protein